MACDYIFSGQSPERSFTDTRDGALADRTPKPPSTAGMLAVYVK